MTTEARAQEPQAAELSQAARPAVRVITTEVLFESATEVILRHGEEEYRLILTKNGKLLLNK